METVTLDSFAAFTVPFAGVHSTGRVIRSDGYVLYLNGKDLWSRGHNHRRKGSPNTYRRFTIKNKVDPNTGKHHQTRRFVHELVAETFLKNPDNKPTVDHKDRDTQNNDVFNLRYATFKEQAQNTRTYLSAPPKEIREQKRAENKRRYYVKHKDEIIARNRERRQRRRSS